MEERKSLGILRVDFPDEVGFPLMWKDLEGFLSHASFLNKHGDAEIPMACQDEKEAVGMQEAEGGGGTYRKLWEGGRKSLWTFRQEILSSVRSTLKKDILS